MDSEEESEQEKPQKPGRCWTERLTGEVRFRRFSALDAGKEPAIFFKFDLAPGQSDLPPEVYSILHEMKHLNRGPEHGGGQHPTGLRFKRTKEFGRVWRLSDTPNGRHAADILDGKLRTLAEKLETEHGRGR